MEFKLRNQKGLHCRFCKTDIDGLVQGNDDYLNSIYKGDNLRLATPEEKAKLQKVDGYDHSYDKIKGKSSRPNKERNTKNQINNGNKETINGNIIKWRFHIRDMFIELYF